MRITLQLCLAKPRNSCKARPRPRRVTRHPRLFASGYTGIVRCWATLSGPIKGPFVVALRVTFARCCKLFVCRCRAGMELASARGRPVGCFGNGVAPCCASADPRACARLVNALADLEAHDAQRPTLPADHELVNALAVHPGTALTLPAAMSLSAEHEGYITAAAQSA